VVAADERDAIWVAHLQAQQQQERLERVEAAIHKVAHEQVVGLRHVAADAEELHQIMELAVDVTAYLRGWIGT